MPIGDRLSLWMMPAFYLAIALCVDELTSILMSIRKRQIPVVSATAFCAAGLIVTADILHAGFADLAGQPQSNHNLDDRAGLRYLMASREAGDAIVATHMSLPAVWWYTGIDLSAREAGGRFADGGPVLELQLRSGNDCTPPKLPRTLEGQKRVLAYLGFDSRSPPGLQELVLDSLSRRGKIVGYRRVAEEGVGAIFDLTQPPAPWTVLVTKPGGRTPVQEVTRPEGCIGFFPAQRW